MCYLLSAAFCPIFGWGFLFLFLHPLLITAQFLPALAIMSLFSGEGMRMEIRKPSINGMEI